MRTMKSELARQVEMMMADTHPVTTVTIANLLTLAISARLGDEHDRMVVPKTAVVQGLGMVAGYFTDDLTDSEWRELRKKFDAARETGAAAQRTMNKGEVVGKSFREFADIPEPTKH